MSMQVHQLHYN